MKKLLLRYRYINQRCNFSSIITTIFILCFFSSCKKGNLDNTPTDFLSPLIGYTWQLVSSTTIDGNGKVVDKYYGSKGDSILFNFRLDQSWNIVPTQINSFVGGKNAIFNYSQSYDFSSKTDLLLLSPTWKQDYSDTLFFPKWNNTEIVFKVKNNNLGGTGYEIDTLKSGRVH